MSLLSVIATGAAFANYRKAKKEYETAVQEATDNNNAYLAAIEQYDNSKWDKLDEYDRRLYDPNVVCKDIIVIPVLNIGMLVGSKCRIQPQLIIQNISEKETVTIQKNSLSYAMFLYKSEQPITGAYHAPFPIVLQPRQKITLTCPVWEVLSSDGAWTWDNWMDMISKSLAAKIAGGVVPITEELAKVKEAFRAANHIPGHANTELEWREGTVIMYALTANISFDYCDSENKDIRRALYEDVKGSCVYKGEMFYPESVWKID